MIFYYINNTDRSVDVSEGTLQITNQGQARSDTCQFEVHADPRPIENQDLAIYDGDSIASIVGATIVLKGQFELGGNKFYPGQVLWLRPKTATAEQVTVLTYTEATLTLVLKAAPLFTTNPGDRLGEIIFGGVIANMGDQNLQLLQHIVYNIKGVDFTKIFDKRLISDSWANVDARYIINDFLNSTVNYNTTLDYLSYATNGAIQAVWTQANDASAPTVDLVDFLEQTASGVFSWIHLLGTAKWTGNLVSKDLSDLVGVANGMPTKGQLMIWAEFADPTKVTAFKIQIGSDNANYLELQLRPTVTGDWGYLSLNLTLGTLVGNPDWKHADYGAIVITETGNSSVKLNGLRVNDQSSFTCYHTQKTIPITDLRSQQKKTTQFINELANGLTRVWYVDYDRDIHFESPTATPAPFQITDTSNNFNDLRISADVANIGNQIIINGGEQTSTNVFSQVFAADGVLRTWLLKNLFANLVMKVDNNTTSHPAELLTNTTNIKITAHGLHLGDWVVNRTRLNAVRQVVAVVDANNFTVKTVTGQTNGDTISYFSVIPTLGEEGLVDESTVDYVYNSDQKSVRASTQTVTLFSPVFIEFAYNERTPIEFEYRDTASILKLKALGLGDGIFDLAPITDNTIQDLGTAILTAKAKVNQFNNPIITGTFGTRSRGFKVGQILTVNISIARTINDTFLIQKVQKKQKGGKFQDYIEFTVTFATTLFGWIELMQKLLRSQAALTNLASNEIVETFVTSDETMVALDSSHVAKGGFKKATHAEVPVATDAGGTHAIKSSLPWQWEASAGQPLPTRWDLFEWA